VKTKKWEKRKERRNSNLTQGIFKVTAMVDPDISALQEDIKFIFNN